MTGKICNNSIDNHYLSKFQSKVKSVTKKEKPLKIQKIRYKINLLTPKKTVCENEKTLKCEICQSWFGKNYYLKIHIRTVHENEKPFRCEICQNCYGVISSLNRHITNDITKIHENKKPFKCENCPMYFGQMVQLHRHVTTVHENHNQN